MSTESSHPAAYVCGTCGRAIALNPPVYGVGVHDVSNPEDNSVSLRTQRRDFFFCTLKCRELWEDDMDYYPEDLEEEDAGEMETEDDSYAPSSSDEEVDDEE